MVRKILGFSFSLLWVCFCVPSLMAQEHGSSVVIRDGRPVLSSDPAKAAAWEKEKKRREKAATRVVYPLFNGISIGADLWGPGCRLIGNDALTVEVSADVNLKNILLPTVELGYSKIDSWSDGGTHYKTGAPYFRIGVDYNAFYSKAFDHKLLVGLRYGMSSFKYDVYSLSVDDDIYGGTINPNMEDDVWGGTVPYDYKGMKATMQWLEFCVGLRAHIAGPIYMGWAIRFKFDISTHADEHATPWYTPGYGRHCEGTKMGVTYTFIYKLPF